MMKTMMLSILCAVALVSGAANAATVEEILAAQPAQTTADQAKWSGAFIALGKDAIVDCSARLVPAGQGDDLAVRYALSGIAKHATRPGAAAEAALVADAFAEALTRATHAEVRAFLLEQIQFTGGDAVVDRVAPFLNDPEVATQAAATLAAIDTARANAALGATPAVRTVDADVAMPEVIEPDEARQAILDDLHAMNGRDLARYIESTHNRDMRLVALTRLAEEDTRRALSVTLDAVKDKDADFRTAALQVAETLDEDSTSKKFLRAMKKADDATAHDIWRMLVRRGDARIPEAPEGVDAEGFRPLFNGVDLKGWDGNRLGYEAKNGELHWRDGGKNLYTDEDYPNFHLRFEFRLEPGSNNGLGVRVPLGGHAASDGIELQILDDDDPQYADIKDYQHHGSVYGVVPAKPGHLKPDGEWNTQEVIVDGYHFTVILNGTTIVDADVAEAAKNWTGDKELPAGLLNKTGRLALLGHNTPVAFRNLYVKKL